MKKVQSKLHPYFRRTQLTMQDECIFNGLIVVISDVHALRQRQRQHIKLGGLNIRTISQVHGFDNENFSITINNTLFLLSYAIIIEGALPPQTEGLKPPGPPGSLPL